jgi:hypothetical protein
LIRIRREFRELEIRRSVPERLPQSAVTAEGGSGAEFEIVELIAGELPAFGKRGMMSVGLLQARVAFSTGFEQATLDLEHSPCLVVRDGFQALLAKGDTDAGDPILPLTGAFLNRGFRDLLGGFGFRQDGGVAFFKLLAGVFVLALEPDELLLGFPFKIARPGGIGVEGGSEPVEKIHRLGRAQQVIHSPS